MNFLSFLSTLLGWLPLIVPVGILVAVFLVYRKLNKGNLTADSPVAQSPSLEPWNAPPSGPQGKYDRPLVHIQPPMDLRR
jgi:hypothetical protein